jgi:hypothetical protein
MGDDRHSALHDVVKRLPSDFEPYGERSRDDEWGPDCSVGCRWFIALEGELRHDWGICHNPASPRCGLLTFEHQGCREFEAEEEGQPDPGTAGGLEEVESVDRPEEAEILVAIRRRLPELEALLEGATDHWGFEDPIYRFYHQSFKVYDLQQQTEAMVEVLRSLAPGRQLAPWFMEIVSEGTGIRFEPEHNADWPRVTRPIVEAFFHARYFLEMAVRYSKLEAPPTILPSGWASILCLYGLR